MIIVINNYLSILSSIYLSMYLHVDNLHSNLDEPSSPPLHQG